MLFPPSNRVDCDHYRGCECSSAGHTECCIRSGDFPIEGDGLSRWVPSHVYLPWVVNGVPECSVPWCKFPPEAHPLPGKTLESES